MASGIRCPSCGAVHHLPPPILLTICECGDKLRHPGHANSSPHSQHHADLYEILGVERTASADDLRAAYRQRARETHPDAGGQPGEFQAVQAAWEVLGDPERRRRYDRSGVSSADGRESKPVPDLLDVSVVTAVRRLISAGFAPRLVLIPEHHDELADVVIGQQPAPGTNHPVGSIVDVAVSGSDAGILWRGIKRDAQRVTDDLKGAATATADSAVKGAKRAIRWFLRTAAIVFSIASVIATSIIVGVYRPVAGLIILFVGATIIAVVIQRTSPNVNQRRKSTGDTSLARRRIGHR